jgi:hypothetical protein
MGKHSFLSTLVPWEARSWATRFRMDMHRVLYLQTGPTRKWEYSRNATLGVVFDSIFQPTYMGMLQFYNYTDYPNECVLLFGVTQCNNILLSMSSFTSKSSIGCSDILEPISLRWVKYYILQYHVYNVIGSSI